MNPRQSSFVVLASGTSSGQPVACVDATAVDHGGATMADARDKLREMTDDVRRHCFTDRGADPATIVAVVTRPASPACDYGLLFVIADGMIGGCGEATMFAAAVHSGGSGTTLAFDTTSGPIAATDLGDHAVRLRMPTPRSAPRAHVLEVDGRELGVRTVAVGGNTFVAVPAADVGFRPDDDTGTLRDEGLRLLSLLANGLAPTMDDPPGLLLLTEPVASGATRSAVTWGGVLNQGPCGTGTCARLILALHDHELTDADELVHYSPFGHAFRVRVAAADEPGDHEVVMHVVGEVNRDPAASSWVG